jgi:hypothetical protein
MSLSWLELRGIVQEDYNSSFERKPIPATIAEVISSAALELQ